MQAAAVLGATNRETETAERGRRGVGWWPYPPWSNHAPIDFDIQHHLPGPREAGTQDRPPVQLVNRAPVGVILASAAF